MSRLANRPIIIPKNVLVNIHTAYVEIKGTKKTLQMPICDGIKILSTANEINVNIDIDQLGQQRKNNLVKLKKKLKILAGTLWANLKNAIEGVDRGFKLELELIGVGYRAQAQGNKISLSLGYSHPIVYTLPAEVTVEIPNQTEIILLSHDKQILGKVAAEIRAYRLPECYKGKGIKFKNQVIIRKEAKKK